MLGIPILLFLEALREATGGIFDTFFLTCTELTDLRNALFLFAILYWCIDKKLGELLLISFNFSRLFNGFLKITACIYRPWIIDPNVHPVEEAMDDLGYSFTSGHATVATILFGGGALYGNVRKGMKVLLIICLFLVCFSRCYLGVHSPADVLCAIASSLIILYITKKVFDKYEDNPNLDLIIAAFGIIVSILLMVYAVTKSYPMDYVAGKLIVDPTEMSIDAFKDAGLAIGMLISWVIERRFIKFTSDGNVESRVMRFIGGFVGYEILLTVVYPIVKDFYIPEVGKFLGYFIFPVYIMIIVPVIIKFFQNRSKEKSDCE